jgi:hypothetical protein
MRMRNLVNLYTAKTDEEIAQLAEDPTQLTPEARSVLLGELTRRRIDLSKPADTEDEAPEFIEQRTAGWTQSLQSYDTGNFIAEVLRVYHEHFWLFVKLMGPAVVIGSMAVLLSHREAWRMIRQLPLGLLTQDSSSMFGIWLVNIAGQFASWTAFCVAFGAICSAVFRIQLGAAASVTECFLEFRRRAGMFLRVTVVLFFLCVFALGFSGLLIGGVIWLSSARHVHINGVAMWMLSFVCTGMCLLLLSRFALAVPAVLLDDYSVRKSLFRSDELTEGKWSTLAALLSKSLIGGYVAGMCPFWLASWIPSSISLPSWFAWVQRAASIAGVTVMEPPMFIGFALLYVRMSQAQSPVSAAIVGETTPWR